MLSLVAFIIVVGLLGWGFFQSFMPENYFSAYPAIPAIFFTFGLSFIAVIHNCEVKQVSVTKPFLIFKVIKFLISVIILFIYMWTTRVFIKEFAITFIVFYLFYIVFETAAVSRYEKMRREGGK